MLVRWLGWAGVEIEAAGAALVIDPLAAPDAVYAWAGKRAAGVPPPELVPSVSTAAVAGLLTHLHRDHADAGALSRALREGAPVLEPPAGGGDNLEEVGLAHADWELDSAWLTRRRMGPWDTVEIEPFRITALPAVDGAGDPQLSWLVQADGRRVLHCGDTLFHGYWWRFAIRCGPPDLAFLPVSGATNDFPNRQPPSPRPAVMPPCDAALAGKLVQARLAVPMHYGGFDFPPHYVPEPDPERAFSRAAKIHDVDARVLTPGDVLNLDEWD